MHDITAYVRGKLEQRRDRLSALDERIITLRFGLEDGVLRSMEEVAQSLGITRERVRQCENKFIRPRCHVKRSKSIRDYYRTD